MDVSDEETESGEESDKTDAPFNEVFEAVPTLSALQRQFRRERQST